MANSSNLPKPPSVPCKNERPSAFDLDESRYQWYFQSIPETILVDNSPVENPFRKRAFYVVHGMGEQKLSSTTAMLRHSFEDAIPKVDPKYYDANATNNWIVPQPFTYDGFWADYDKINEFVPRVWGQLNQREEEFFSRVWTTRSISKRATVFWFIRMGCKIIKRSPRATLRLYYSILVPQILLVLILSCVFKKSRDIIRRFLNDVRLYLSPKGDIEHRIVQQIDHIVGRRFLRLLGLNWEFDELLPCDQVHIGGKPHVFDQVVWVSHSLGTVISYNVLGDILRRCQEFRKKSQKIAQVERVERGISGFVTMGSPLDKVHHLFHDTGVLRTWPKEYLPGGTQSLWERPSQTTAFWTNFHYNSDPVSGQLDAFKSPNRKDENLVTNIHPGGLRFLGFSHTSYWSDRLIMVRLLNMAFRDQTEASEPHLFVTSHQDANRIRKRWAQRFFIVWSALVWAVLIPFTLIALLLYLVHLGLSFFGVNIIADLLKNAFELLKSMA